jgi:hypothetical protein|nr:MAG TPA: hypothetical protein [Caudoviricetes sp.]
MNKTVLEVMHRLRGITDIEEQGFVSGRSWKEPIYTVLFKEEGEYDDLPDCNEAEFTPVDYIRKRRKDDHQFLAWAKVRTDEKDESKLDSAIWETVIKTINFCQCQNSDQGDVGYLMAITVAIDEIIKYTNPKLIVDLRALEITNSMLIDRYLDDIYNKQKFMLNSVSGPVVTKCRPPMYMMPNSKPLSMEEAGNVDQYLDFMKAKAKRLKVILDEVIKHDRKLDGSRYGTLFLMGTVALSLIDANEEVDQKYKLEYADWMNEYRDVHKHAFDSNKADVYQSAMTTLFHSHAICEAIGKKRIFSTPGFKMLLEEAQEVLVYSKAHFKMVSDNRDDRYNSIIKETWDNIAKIDHLEFIRAVPPSKDGCINDLECHLVVKKDDLELIYIIHVNKMAFQLAFAHLKHELNISGDLIRDIIYLSLLKDFADGYCRDKPLEKALDKIVDGCDIRIVSKLRDVLTVQFIDGSLLDVSDFINDIGGLRYTYSLNYTVEGR